ncbi:MAG TPA: hypothetical protein V6D15_08385 [Oculatellaceae cyanobacterium]
MRTDKLRSAIAPSLVVILPTKTFISPIIYSAAHALLSIVAA